MKWRSSWSRQLRRDGFTLGTVQYWESKHQRSRTEKGYEICNIGLLGMPLTHIGWSKPFLLPVIPQSSIWKRTFTPSLGCRNPKLSPYCWSGDFDCVCIAFVGVRPVSSVMALEKLYFHVETELSDTWVNTWIQTFEESTLRKVIECPWIHNNIYHYLSPTTRHGEIYPVHIKRFL